MKKYVYMTQDMVSHATSELFTSENDATVTRMIKAQVDNMEPSMAYTVKDSTIFKLGMIVIDDDTGAISVCPYDTPVVVCRAGSFLSAPAEVISHEMA